jgi:hypothetical protein
LLIGQNGFLMTAIFISGALVLNRNPWLAGALFGLLVLKPQLALALPIAMLAGLEWRVIAGAVAAVSALLLIGLILFGADSYRAFLGILPHYVDLLRDSRLPWNELASPFALARFVGLPQAQALALHSIIAVIAIALTARAWRLGLEERVPILATATMLVPPYLFTYDTLLLIIPLGWMIRAGRYPYVAVVWLCTFLPLLTYYTPIVGPNLTPIGAIICLWVLHLGPSQRRLGHPPRSPPGAVEASLAS